MPKTLAVTPPTNQALGLDNVVGEAGMIRKPNVMYASGRHVLESSSGLKNSNIDACVSSSYLPPLNMAGIEKFLNEKLTTLLENSSYRVSADIDLYLFLVLLALLSH